MKRKKRDFSLINTKSTNSALEIPVSLFLDRSLSVFEILTEFLKETHNLSYHKIAVLTNRDERTIWTVYSRTKKKRKKNPKLKLQFTNVHIPLSIFLDRNIAVLEAVVVYLKERLKYSFKEIAELTGRNNRTIWTVYSRAKQKSEYNYRNIIKQKFK